MERLHILTLFLEMTGFALAYIHVFRENFAHRAIQRVEIIREKWFSGFALNGADIDKSIPLKNRIHLANGNVVFVLLQVVALIVIFTRLNFGRGFLWGVAEFLVAVVVCGLVALPALVILLVAVNAITFLAVTAGRGNMIIGTGFFLAAAGMTIETYQVWESPYRWTVYVLWGVAMLLVLGASLKPNSMSD